MGALNRTQKEYMYRHGWLISEIRCFDNARIPDNKRLQNLRFDSAPFQDMLRTRDAYVNRLKALGWSDLQIRHRINMLYITKRGKTSPWDFLKIEYRPAKTISDTMWATMLKSKLRIAKKLGAGYSKPMRKEIRPKYIPVIRELPPMPKK